MTPGNNVALVGNVTRDPELRYTKSGRPVADLGLAVNRRWRNNQTNDWDEEVSYFDITAWSDLAENVAASIRKGDRIMVEGRLKQDTWTDDDDKNRSKIVVIADDIGPSLRWAEASIKKNEKKNNGSSSRGERRDSDHDDRGSRRQEPPRDYYPDDEPF